MKAKLFGILVCLAMCLSLVAVVASPVKAATLTVGPGGTYSTIQAAITAAAPNDIISVAAGTYTEIGQIAITKNLSIVGADKATTIIKTNIDTTQNVGDAKAWFLVGPDVVFNLSQVTLDGTGHKIWQGIRDKGKGTINDCAFTNIGYNPSGPDYAGQAVVVFGTAGNNVNVTNCTFSQIGRVGVLFSGAGITGSTFTGNTYVGKGTGNWLDYSVEVNGGAVATISNNTISDCTGVASSDGSVSAGLQVTVYIGAGTQATITHNTITNCYYGIAVGFQTTDTSTVAANFNSITGCLNQGIHTPSLVNTVSAENNWWGDISGPSGVGYGSGDAVSANVDYDPWLSSPGGFPITFTSQNKAATATVSLGTVASAVQTGTPTTVTVAQYSANPGAGTFAGDIGKYIDVYAPVTTGVTQIEVRLNYTDAEVAGLVESSLRLYYWNGSSWAQCSDSGVDTGANYIWARITASSLPNLSYLSGQGFGGGGNPPAPHAGSVFPSIYIAAIAVAAAGVIGYAIYRRRAKA